MKVCFGMSPLGTDVVGIAGAQGKRALANRVTARTQLVLAAVAQLNEPDYSPSNREVADAAGVRDQGQISKLLARLQNRGLLQNTNSGHAASNNAWQLTPQGEEVVLATAATN